MFKLKLIKPGDDEIDPIIINTAKEITCYMLGENDKLFNQQNCKELEAIYWSKVGSYKIETSTNPIYFDPSQWIIERVL